MAAAGINATPVPTDFATVSDPVISPGRYLPSVSALSRNTVAIHEIAGYLAYRTRGWIEP